MTVFVKSKTPIPEHWQPLYANDWSESFHLGPRGTGKTYELSRWNTGETLRHITDPYDKTVIMRETKTQIEDTIYADMSKHLLNAVSQHEPYKRVFKFLNGRIKKNLDRDSETNDDALKTSCLITKGFRKSRIEQKADMKGLGGIRRAVLDEVEDVIDVDQIDTLRGTLREEGVKLVVAGNVPPKNHWAIKQNYNLEATDYEGWYKPVPKQRKGVLITYTTLFDNPFLTPEYVQKMRNLGDPTHDTYNEYMYLKDVLGLCEEYRKGVIFTPAHYTRDQNMDLSNARIDQITYGLDFGFIDALTVTMNQYESNTRTLRSKELLYASSFTPTDIIDWLDANIPNKSLLIVADGARPEIIRQIVLTGRNIVAAKKGAGSIQNGIDRLKSFGKRWIVCGVNLINELESYSFKLNADGTSTGVPEDKNNHGIDSIRYATSKMYIV